MHVNLNNENTVSMSLFTGCEVYQKIKWILLVKNECLRHRAYCCVIYIQIQFVRGIRVCTENGKQLYPLNTIEKEINILKTWLQIIHDLTVIKHCFPCFKVIL